MRNRIENDPRTGSGSATMVTLALLGVMAAGPGVARAQQPPAPQPSVPEVFTLEGEYVRIAYNNDGFASMGYRMASQEVGHDWMLLTVGITLRKPTKDYTFKREHLSLQTPDGKTLPLPTEKEYGAANLAALNMRAKVIVDSINYFPSDAYEPCSLKFFADLDGPGSGLAYDQVDLSSQRVCLGRLYFHVPGGIQAGQHYLNLQFAGSKLQVPFRTVTKEEEKVLSKKWQDFKKAHEAAMKQ